MYFRFFHTVRQLRHGFGENQMVFPSKRHYFLQCSKYKHSFMAKCFSISKSTGRLTLLIEFSARNCVIGTFCGKKKLRYQLSNSLPRKKWKFVLPKSDQIAWNGWNDHFKSFKMMYYTLSLLEIQRNNLKLSKIIIFR